MQSVVEGGYLWIWESRCAFRIFPKSFRITIFFSFAIRLEEVEKLSLWYHI